MQGATPPPRAKLQGPFPTSGSAFEPPVDVQAPQNYSRGRNAVSVHKVRVQNLRWRVSADWRRPKGLPLPPSLQSLADDHLEDAVARSQPSKQTQKRHRGVLRHTRSASPLARAASSRLDVNFDSRIYAEVPVLSSPTARKKVPPRRGSGAHGLLPPPQPAAAVRCTRSDHQARANLARLMANHRRMSSGSCFGEIGCFKFLSGARASAK
mmetsp:Transcript_117544/g.327365  ORF Transcript_117544/g.327365 Transcript_117544/m.327365 type:complete len:210 (-) Transcript_117544:138-767(-)